MKVDLLRVKAERVAKGYTQAKMAELMGLISITRERMEKSHLPLTNLSHLLTYWDTVGMKSEFFLSKPFPKRNNKLKERGDNATCISNLIKTT